MRKALASAGTGSGLRRIWHWIRRNVLFIKSTDEVDYGLEFELEPDRDPAGFIPEPPPIEPARARIVSITAPPRPGLAIAPIRHGLSEIPPLPHVVRQLLAELSDPESCSRSVARIAASDPILAASLLRTVNSAAIGLRRKVTSVAEAISYLGYSLVRSMVVRMRLQQIMPTRPGQCAYDAEDLWVHSLAVAHAAEALAQRAGGADRSIASTLGLLHDIGKLAINSYFPDSAQLIRTPSPQYPGESMLDREQRVLGADHAEIGAMLATHWKLPADLVEAIRWHHAPQQAPATMGPDMRKAATLVHIANQLAKFCYVYSDDMEIDIVADETLRAAGLPAPMQRLLGSTTQQAISRAIFFADESSTQPLSAIRRFLRLGASVPALAPPEPAEPWRGTGPRVGWIDQHWEQQLCRDPLRVDCTLHNTVRLREAIRAAGEHVRFVARVVPSTVERLLEACSIHLESLPIDWETRMPARCVIRRLVPNLHEIAPGERVEVFICMEGQTLVTAIRSPALTFARRMGIDVSPRCGKAALSRELANILNLRWFRRIGVSADGSTLLMTSHKPAQVEEGIFVTPTDLAA